MILRRHPQLNHYVNQLGLLVQPIACKFVYWVKYFALSALLYPHQLFQSGVFAPLTWVAALGLTWGAFALFNRWASERVEVAFSNGLVQGFSNATSVAETVNLATEMGWADRRLHPWLQSVLRPPGNHFPASEQVVELFAVPESDAPKPEVRRQLLHRMVTGDQRPNWPTALPSLPNWIRDWVCAGIPLSIHPPIGADIYRAQTALYDGIWLKTIEVSDPALADDKKQFVRHYVDGFVEVVKPSLRYLQRLNGWAQWFTVLLTCVLLVAGVRRVVMIVFLARSASLALAEVRQDGRCDPEKIRPSSNEVAELVRILNYPSPTFALRYAQAPEELRRKVAAAELGVYGLYMNLLSAIPALGFMGTVYGIGEALLRADGLFTAADKARSVAIITSELGFAFDTTFVALICSTLAAVIFSIVRLAEQRVLNKWAEILDAMGGREIE